MGIGRNCLLSGFVAMDGLDGWMDVLGGVMHDGRAGDLDAEMDDGRTDRRMLDRWMPAWLNI